MTPLAHDTGTAASHLAERYLAGNLLALRQTQPELAERIEPVALAGQFIFARDGSLSARESDGRWVAGCSLPLRAAQAMLESLQNRSPVACFLEPSHAAQLAVVLERFDRTQAVIATISNIQTLQFLLCCHDFSGDLTAQRLWFAAGDDWSDELSRLMRQHEGLPIPSSFIRLPVLSEEVAETQIRIAREVFAAETARRAERVTAVRETWRLGQGRRANTEKKRVCVVTPSHFRLWDDAGSLLRGALCTDESFVAFDPDRPTTASPLAFAAAAGAAGAVITAGVFRADVPDVVPLDLPWITFVSSPRIAAPVAGAARDRILLTDAAQQALAVKLGWRRECLVMASWPATAAAQAGNSSSLTLIANTFATDHPPEPLDLSSHQLLWDLIRSEIAANPFVIGGDIGAYLNSRRRRLEIADEGFDRALFIDRLIVPAYQQAIARLLVRRGVALYIHGSGWGDIPEIALHARGPVATREAFLTVIRQAGALLHAWPIQGPHQVDAWQRPVVRTFGCDEATLLRRAQGQHATPPPAYPPLSPALLHSLVT